MWAVLLDGRVVDVTDIDPKNRFHRSLDWVALKGSETVMIGEQYEGEGGVIRGEEAAIESAAE